MRIALDTNVLVYAENIAHEDADRLKVSMARDIVRRAQNRIVVPIQAVTELGRVGLRRGGWNRTEAAIRMRHWLAFPTVPLSPAVLARGIELVEHRMVSIYDAMVIAAAAESRCDVLLTEDRQSAKTLSGVRLLNPFSEEDTDVVRALLE